MRENLEFYFDFLSVKVTFFLEFLLSFLGRLPWANSDLTELVTRSADLGSKGLTRSNSVVKLLVRVS